MTCNHCDGQFDFSKLTDFQRMCFRGMCHSCEAMTLAERIETFPKLQALAEQISNLGLGINGPFSSDWMRKG